MANLPISIMYKSAPGNMACDSTYSQYRCGRYPELVTSAHPSERGRSNYTGCRQVKCDPVVCCETLHGDTYIFQHWYSNLYCHFEKKTLYYAIAYNNTEYFHSSEYVHC